MLLVTLLGCESVAEKPKVLTEEVILTGDQYIVTLEIRQTHFTIDPFEHWKDKENALNLPILVSEEYYNAVYTGMVLDDSFRVGSFWIDGSIGNWKITVINKEKK